MTAGLWVVPAIRLKANGDLGQVDAVGLQGRLSNRGGPESVERHSDVGVASFGWKPEHIGCAGACAIQDMRFDRGAGLCNIRQSGFCSPHLQVIGLQSQPIAQELHLTVQRGS